MINWSDLICAAVLVCSEVMRAVVGRLTGSESENYLVSAQALTAV